MVGVLPRVEERLPPVTPEGQRPQGAWPGPAGRYSKGGNQDRVTRATSDRSNTSPVALTRLIDLQHLVAKVGPCPLLCLRAAREPASGQAPVRQLDDGVDLLAGVRPAGVAILVCRHLTSVPEVGDQRDSRVLRSAVLHQRGRVGQACVPRIGAGRVGVGEVDPVSVVPARSVRARFARLTRRR